MSLRNKLIKIVILSEGGSNIGFGHITRCTALYQAFKNSGINPLFIVNGDKAAGDVLRDYDYLVFNWLKDRHKLFNIVKGSDIAVIDSYLAAEGIYKEIALLTKTAVYFDDNMRIGYPEGIVINGAIFAELMKYPKNSGVEYLLGSRYALLRKEFWVVPAKRLKSDIKSIMVTLGGTDSRNMAPQVLRFLNSKFPGLVKNVIIGAGFKNTEEIEQVKDEKTNLIHTPDAKKMRAVMLESDIAISAGGQTLYELARIGVPAIGVCIADNQLYNLKEWRRAGFLEYIGWYNDKRIIEKLGKSIKGLNDFKVRKKKQKIGVKFVDGKGSLRIVETLCKKLKKIR